MQKNIIQKMEHEAVRIKKTSHDHSEKPESSQAVTTSLELQQSQEDLHDDHRGCQMEISLLHKKMGTLMKELEMEKEKASQMEEEASRAVEEYRRLEEEKREELGRLIEELRIFREKREANRVAGEWVLFHGMNDHVFQTWTLLSH